MRYGGRFLVCLDGCIYKVQTGGMEKDAGYYFRLPARLLKDARERAEERGEKLSDVLRDALERYVRKP